MNEVICHSILDDMVGGPDVFETIYVGTLEEPINIYDSASKIGCYVVLSAIEQSTNQVRVGRILVSEFVKDAGQDADSVAKEIQFGAANLVATYVKQTVEEQSHPTKVARGMVAIPRGLLWPAAVSNFMSKGENGHWQRVFAI